MSEFGYSLVFRSYDLSGEGPLLVSQGHGWDRQDLRSTMDCGPKAAALWFRAHATEMIQHGRRITTHTQPTRKTRTRSR